MTHVQGGGVIDEGVDNPEVLRQYEREFEDDERALEEECSADEDEEHDEHVPRDWQNFDFSQFSVNDGENVPCEYRENEVCVGGMYPTTEHVKDAVKRWSTLNLHREFRVLKSSPSIYEVCCVKSNCAF